MKKIKQLEIVQWPTSTSCVKYFFSSQPKKKRISSYDESGKKWTYTPEELLKAIRRNGSWGFIENKKIIHFWRRRNTKNIRHLFELFAHEYGHTIKPHYFKNRKQEEIKAARYASAATFAFDFFLRLGFELKLVSPIPQKHNEAIRYSPIERTKK